MDQAHAPQLAHRGEAEALGELRGALVVSVGPGAQGGKVRALGQGLEQGAGDPVLAERGVHGKFQGARLAGGAQHRDRGADQLAGIVVGAFREVGVGAEDGVGVRLAAQLQQRLFAQRRVAVGLLGRCNKRAHRAQDVLFRCALDDVDGDQGISGGVHTPKDSAAAPRRRRPRGFLGVAA